MDPQVPWGPPVQFLHLKVELKDFFFLSLWDKDKESQLGEYKSRALLQQAQSNRLIQQIQNNLQNNYKI